MADDPKLPAKTMIGWLPSTQPSQPSPQGPPAWGRQPAQPYAGVPGYPQPMPPGAQGYGPQGFSPPAQGYGPPQGYGTPGQAPQSFAQPSYAPPQGYRAPQHDGYGSPQGYGPPQGYGAPGQPAQGFAQPSYAPPQGHGPPGQPPQSFPAPSHGSAYNQAAPAYAPQPAGHGYPQAPAGFVQAMRGYGPGQAAAAAISDPRLERPIPEANATVGVSDRVHFIRQTYAHLFGALVAFSGLLYLLLTNETLVRKISLPLCDFAFGPRWHWAIVLGAMIAVSWVADSWAQHATSRALQYAGLALYVVAESLIFVPLLMLVAIVTHDIVARGGHDPNILRDAAITTLAIFGALTASVFITRKDFSWMRSGLMMASGAALALIALSLAFGFNLGIVFSIGMVLLAAGQILYKTSQVLAHYNPRQHVAAALSLFSSVVLLLWYVIRIFMRMRR